MCYKSRTVYFKHEYIVHNPYLATIHKLYPTLVAHGVNGEADAVAGIYMPSLGQETDVERHACHVTRCLWRVETCNALTCARIVPLPLLYVAAKFGVGLCDAHVLNVEIWLLITHEKEETQGAETCLFPYL